MNWWGILIFLLISGAVAYMVYKNTVSRKLKEKIGKMKLEKKAILQLMKKLQQERFKENKIPDLVYEIKMKNYKERLSAIKAKLPVLESKLQVDEKNNKNKLLKEKVVKKKEK